MIILPENVSRAKDAILRVFNSNPDLEWSRLGLYQECHIQQIYFDIALQQLISEGILERIVDVKERHIYFRLKREV